MTLPVLALLLWLAHVSPGVAQDSSHYAVFAELERGVVFDDTGALAVLAEKELFFVPRQARFHQLSLPKLANPDAQARLLALGTGVWLRAGRTIAYASLERHREAEPYEVSSNLAWQTLELASDASEDRGAVLDERERLCVQLADGKVQRLAPSAQGISSEFVSALPTRRSTLDSGVVCEDHGEHVELSYQDESRRAHTVTLPKLKREGRSRDEHALCAAHVAQLRGRVWFASDDYVFSQELESWLVIKQQPKPSLWARAREFVHYHSLDYQPFWLVVASGLLLGGTSWLSRERPRHVPLARALGASLLAPPSAFLTASAFDAVTHGVSASAHGLGGAVFLFLVPAALVAVWLPATGAWLGDRLSRDRARFGGGNILRGLLGTTVGMLLAMPLALKLVREYVEPVAAASMLLVVSTLVGVCTAFAYSSRLAKD